MTCLCAFNNISSKCQFLWRKIPFQKFSFEIHLQNLLTLNYSQDNFALLLDFLSLIGKFFFLYFKT